MNKYRKKPVVIEAIQWKGDNLDKINALGGTQECHLYAGYLIIETLEGEMKAREGDWIIKGVKGELYPCKPDIFKATYEAI